LLAGFISITLGQRTAFAIASGNKAGDIDMMDIYQIGQNRLGSAL
jgi:hypothetical protein